MSLLTTLQAARRGLQVSSEGINVVGHNTANATNENYAPQLEFLLDTYQDYKFLKRICNYDKKNMLTTSELITLCKSKKINIKKKIIRKNKSVNKFIKLSK